MVRLAGVLIARPQVAVPLSARVTVTVGPETEVVAVAVQLGNPLVSATVGVAGIENPVGKPTVILEPAARAPVALEFRPTVHVVVDPALCRAPVNETGAGEVAGSMVMLSGGEAANESDVVATVKPDLS